MSAQVVAGWAALFLLAAGPTAGLARREGYSETRWLR